MNQTDKQIIEDLVAALENITNHFADVMGGPLMRQAGVLFEHGPSGIPTIVAARAAIAKAKEGQAVCD